MTDTTQLLDPEELLHVGMAAVERQDFETALSAFKRAVAAGGRHPRAHYLLGATYAQIGMHERALEQMRIAVEADPGLHTARLQIGLLLLGSGHAEQAVQAWDGLDGLGEEHPLWLFKTGLVRMLADQFDEAQQFVARGLAANHNNPALSRDMSRVLAYIEQARSRPAEEPASQHVMVSAYGAAGTA